MKSCLLLGIALSAAPLVGQSAIGDLYSGDANVRGSVSISPQGMQVLSGSQVAAGEASALLRLGRGGQLRICPRTSLSLSEGATHGLVLGLNAGSLELDYMLNSGADILLTPDFRLQLIGPGAFHFAVSVAPSGDTCLRTLRGDDAAVFVAEMIGNDSYQLSPGKSVLFRGGKISGASDAPANCGCPEFKPAPQPEPMLAAPVPPAAPPSAAEPHLEVNSSFVYSGSSTRDEFSTTVARLSESRDNSMLAMALVTKVSPPPVSAAPPEKKHTFMHRVKRFFQQLLR